MKYYSPLQLQPVKVALGCAVAGAVHVTFLHGSTQVQLYGLTMAVSDPLLATHCSEVNGQVQYVLIYWLPLESLVFEL